MGVLAGYDTPLMMSKAAGTQNAVQFGDLGFNSETFDVTNPEQVGQLQAFLNKQGLYTDKALDAGGSIGDQIFGGNTEKAYQQYVNQQRELMGNEAYTQPVQPAQQAPQNQGSMLGNAWGNIKGAFDATKAVGNVMGNVIGGVLGAPGSIQGLLGLGAQNTSEANSMSNNEANNITNSTTGVDKTDEQKGYESFQQRMKNFASSVDTPTYGGYNF